VNVWRTISKAPFYEVSSLGGVRRVTPGQGTKTGPLKPKVDRYGYVYFTLSFGPGRPQKHFKAHRLVCEAFHGPPPSPRHGVAHGDGDPANNRADNLRWATGSENMADMVAHGRSRAKLTSDQVLEIRSSSDSHCRLADRYGVSRETVRKVVIGSTWQGLLPC
jgi:hypothetical protein